MRSSSILLMSLSCLVDLNSDLVSPRTYCSNSHHNVAREDGKRHCSVPKHVGGVDTVLLCFIDPRVRKIRNEASSWPGIFSRTLRFYYVLFRAGPAIKCFCCVDAIQDILPFTDNRDFLDVHLLNQFSLFHTMHCLAHSDSLTADSDSV